ncbi:MAG: hypothetical protein PHG00_14060 [Methylococcales bacterium]|nr:hypothetical protein [Methylococcales bacterium]
MAKTETKTEEDNLNDPTPSAQALMAKAATKSQFLAANTITCFNRVLGQLNLISVAEELEAQIDQIKKGDMDRAEETLAAQAGVLDTLFNSLAIKSLQALSLDQQILVFKLALQVQKQCCQTYEALAAIKNPPSVTVVRQTNIGQAVQVNNSKADNIPKPDLENELLEHTHGQRLDFGTRSTSIQDNSNLEAMEMLDGSKSQAGKARASRNADQGLEWPALSRIRTLMKTHRELLTHSFSQANSHHLDN